MKAIALMRLGRYEDALKALPADSHFERAYSLYRLNRLTDALAAIKASGSAELKYKYLQAQLVSIPYSILISFLIWWSFSRHSRLSLSLSLFQNYKLENFGEAATILEGVLQSATLVTFPRRPPSILRGWRDRANSFGFFVGGALQAGSPHQLRGGQGGLPAED